MKHSFFAGLVFIGVLIIFSGCAPPVTAPPRPSDGTIYDANGNPIYVPNPPMPEQRPDAAPPPDRAGTGREAPETPSPEPPPRIGAGDGGSGNGHLMAAVSPLREQAQEQMNRGEYDRALATVERAIRIDSTNPELWQLMAQVQLGRGEYDQAEQLARKSNLLAGNNDSLRSENWTLIADSYSARGERKRAEDARRTARRLKRR